MEVDGWVHMIASAYVWACSLVIGAGFLASIFPRYLTATSQQWDPFDIIIALTLYIVAWQL